MSEVARRSEATDALRSLGEGGQTTSFQHQTPASFTVFSPPSNFMDFMISPKRTGGNPTFSAVVGATPENPFEQKAKVAILPKEHEMTPSVTQTADLIFKRPRQKRRTAGESSLGRKVDRIERFFKYKDA